MSNTESFVDEVNEDLRRDRLYQMMRRYGWIAVLAVLLLVGGAAYREWSRAQAEAAAQARGDALLTAIEIEDAAERAAALAGEEGVLAQLAQASSLVEAGDQTAALAVLKAMAADESLGAPYRDLAQFKSALLTDALSAAERRAALSDISAPGRPYALLAQEQIAMIDLAEGARDEGIAALSAIYENAEISSGQKQRISALLTALGAAPEAGAANGEQG